MLISKGFVKKACGGFASSLEANLLSAHCCRFGDIATATESRKICAARLGRLASPINDVKPPKINEC